MKLRIATMVFAIAVATVDVACFNKPEAPMLAGSHDGGGGSDSGTMMIDSASKGSGMDAPLACPQPSDTFDMGTACGAWGQVSGSGATPTRSNGELVVSPGISMTSGCQTAAPFSFANGSTIEIPQRATSGMPGNLTFFSVSSGAGSDSSLTVTIDDDSTVASVRLTCLGGTTTVVNPFTYDLTQHRWIRFLRNAMTPSNVEAWVSGDGTMFNVIPGSACGWVSSPDTVIATMGVTNGADISTAHFDHFNTNPCPPP